MTITGGALAARGRIVAAVIPAANGGGNSQPTSECMAPEPESEIPPAPSNDIQPPPP